MAPPYKLRWCRCCQLWQRSRMFTWNTALGRYTDVCGECQLWRKLFREAARSTVVELAAGNRPEPHPKRSYRAATPARDLWHAWTGNAIPDGEVLEIGLAASSRLVHVIDGADWPAPDTGFSKLGDL